MPPVGLVERDASGIVARNELDLEGRRRGFSKREQNQGRSVSRSGWLETSKEGWKEEIYSWSSEG